jgi:subtilisin-like proprotein convertase family protein
MPQLRYGGKTGKLIRYEVDRSAKGTWKLEVQDEERIDTGMIRQFGLELSLDRGLRSVSKKAAKGRRKRK